MGMPYGTRALYASSASSAPTSRALATILTRLVMYLEVLAYTIRAGRRNAEFVDVIDFDPLGQLSGTDPPFRQFVPRYLRHQRGVCDCPRLLAGSEK